MALDAELHEILRRTCSSLGSTFTSKGSARVLAQPSNRMLFAKIGQHDQVLGEAESLQAMYRASLAASHGDTETLIPTVHAFGATEDGRRAFLVTDYKDLGGSLGASGQRTLGTKLAQMHLHGTSDNGMYGFSRPTHCGETEQDNTWTASWADFWADHRIGDLVQRSGDRELASLEHQLREKVYPLLFCAEAMRGVKPAIIHGDLWSGNSGSDQATGQPIIFDPSSSYSHNEAELGIMKMFGGYTSDFFNAYHKVIPKAQPYYNERQDLYEAFHHLNHFVIFGGGYRSGTVRIFKKLIAWADEEWRKGGPPSGGGGDGDDDSGSHGRGLRGGSSRLGDVLNTQGHAMAPDVGFPPQGYNNEPPPPGAAGSLATHVSSLANQPIQQQQQQQQQQFDVPQSETKPAYDTTQHQTYPSLLAPTPSQIADFFSQMVCYIWYSSGVPGRSRPATPTRSPASMHSAMHSSPLAPRRYVPNVNNCYGIQRTSVGSFPATRHSKTASAGGLPASVPATDLSKAIQDHLIASTTSPSAEKVTSLASDPAMLRLQPRGRFLRFTRDLLATTQVSTSVITLALIYISRLKAMHPHMKGREGSEYRLAISSLMLANKILDDNTYLNKTWAEISDMPLIEISKMETEFWLGLKMELHVSKDEYDAGLHDLQSLANDRTRAIREREAVLKRLALQQQRHTAQNLHYQPSNVLGSRHGSLYASPQWSASSESFSPHQAHSSAWQQSIGIRHSVGHADQLPFRSWVHHNSFNTGAASDFGTFAPSHISPPQASSYTLPSSPMSQVSGVPSLAMTSNEALNCSEAEARTPQEYLMPGSVAAPSDATWHTPGTIGQPWSSRPPSEYNAFEQATTGWSSDMQAYNSSSSTGTAPSRPPISSITMPAHRKSVSYLKRDFERAKLGSASPADERCAKRFAPDATSELEHLRHYQFPSNLQASAGVQSPAGSQTSMGRATSLCSPLAGRDMLPYKVQSQSPSQATSLTRYSSPAFQTHNDGIALPPVYSVDDRPSRSHQYGMSTTTAPSSHSLLPVQQHHPSQLQQAPYHSVFASALTPTSLTAPVENVRSSAYGSRQWPMQRQKGPLQYYSLAAGEPRGVLGSYMPPANPYTANRQPPSSTAGDIQSMAAQQSSIPTHAWTTPPVPSVATISPAPYGGHTNSQQYSSNAAMTSSAPPTSSLGPTQTMGGFSSGDTYDSVSKMHFYPRLSQLGPHDFRQSTDSASYGNGHSQLQPPQPQPQQNGLLQASSQAPPPFALDVNSWPLVNTSMASYLFPYHLVPAVPASDRAIV